MGCHDPLSVWQIVLGDCANVAYYGEQGDVVFCWSPISFANLLGFADGGGELCGLDDLMVPVSFAGVWGHNVCWSATGFTIGGGSLLSLLRGGLGVVWYHYS